MTKAYIRRVIPAAALVAVALILVADAQANFNALSKRLPASSNAVVAVNVEKVLNAPYAKSEQWAQTSTDAWAKQPLMIPPGSVRLLHAAEVRTDTMEPYWEMALMEMKSMPPLESLAKAEGGNIDRIWETDAVYSPINAYFVPLDGRILASITPANRSAIAKWLRAPATRPEGAVSSEYIQKVLASLGDKTDIVLAMDLEGAWGVPRIRRWLDDNDIKEIQPAQLDEIVRTLGTMQGITLNIGVDKDVTGRAVVDFGRDAASLKDAAKPILIGVLNTAGMRIDDLGDWSFSAAGTRVSMEGKLSASSLRKLLSIVQSPIPAVTVAEKPAADGKAPATPAQASQRYYKAVTASLDNFPKTASASESAGWARATAKRIDQLPILNVDPQLVQWGTMVATKLKQAGATMGIGQTQMDARAAGVLDPGYAGYSYDSDGNYYAQVDTVQMENARRQRRQAALEQKAQAQEQALQILNEIAETRPAIRAAMVEKYQVEF